VVWCGTDTEERERLPRMEGLYYMKLGEGNPVGRAVPFQTTFAGLERRTGLGSVQRVIKMSRGVSCLVETECRQSCERGCVDRILARGTRVGRRLSGFLFLFPFFYFLSFFFSFFFFSYPAAL
jgi:hypothetical protein